jgi:hypothetical protein
MSDPVTEPSSMSPERTSSFFRSFDLTCPSLMSSDLTEFLPPSAYAPLLSATKSAIIEIALANLNGGGICAEGSWSRSATCKSRASAGATGRVLPA